MAVMDDRTQIKKAVAENLKSRFMQIDGNMYVVDRLFMAIGVVNYAIDKEMGGEISRDQLVAYFNAIEKYLEKEIDIFWEDGIIRFRKPKPDYGEQEEIRRAALKSLERAYKTMFPTNTDTIDE